MLRDIQFVSSFECSYAIGQCFLVENRESTLRSISFFTGFSIANDSGICWFSLWDISINF